MVKKAGAEGHDVAVLARTPEKPAIQDEKLMVVQGDVTDKTAVVKTVDGVER